MTAEEIQKLGEAIAQNAELLAEFDGWEDEPIELLEVSQSFGLLKNARLIEQIDDTQYLPGENFELLRKAIHTSNYELNTIPDIASWLNDFKHLASQFVLLAAQDDQTVQPKRALNRKLHQLTANLKASIREIDLNASAEFGYCKTLEAKIKENHFYAQRTREILDKLERLNYHALLKVSDHPEIEDITLNRAHPKIEDLRRYLQLVLGKLQKLSISFIETEARTRKLRQILIALNEKRLNPPGLVDSLEFDSVEIFNAISAETIGMPLAGYGLEDSHHFNRSRFEDIARKIKLSKLAGVPEKTYEAAYLQAEPELEAEQASFETALEACKLAFAQRVQTELKAMSLVNYWQQTPAIQQLISADAWVFDMSHWLKTVQQNLPENQGQLDLNWVESRVHALSDITVVRDVIVTYQAEA